MNEIMAQSVAIPHNYTMYNVYIVDQSIIFTMTVSILFNFYYFVCNVLASRTMSFNIISLGKITIDH